MLKTFFATMRMGGLRYRGFALLYIVMSLVVSGSTVAMTRLRGDMGETALDGDVDLLVRFLLIVSVIALVRAVFAALSSWMMWRFYGAMGHSLRRNFIHHFLRLPFATLEKAGSGKSLSVLTNDVPGATAFGGPFWGGLINLVVLLFEVIITLAALMFMFGADTTRTLAMLGSFAFIAIIQVVSSIPIGKHNIAVSKETANFNAIVNDSLQNVSTVAAYGLEDVLEKRYLTQYDNFMAALGRLLKAILLLASMGFMSTIVPFAVISVVVGSSVINGYMSVGEFVAYTGLLVIVGQNFSGLAEQLGNVQANAARAKRTLETTADPVEELAASDVVAPDKIGTISFKNVTFTYGEDLPMVLDGISFDIKPGSRVAFVGGSGSGKSTVLKLLMGLYEPNNGEIILGGDKPLGKAALRDCFAYVPQDSFLFPVSIAENITLQDDIADKARLERACADAGILDFIQSLPDGFNSVLTEASENISGGQRQRIAMARAFYRDAPVILFDEATSSLDPATEAAILDNFTEASKGRTVIMVAHRESVVATCDVVIKLENGRVAL